MKAKAWIMGWFAIVVIALITIGKFVYRVDPYFHYHKPDMDHYYYVLDNQRSQNDGICKYFDYDSLITGTSMTENFKTSELDEMFGVHSIKVSYSGASYKEINDNLINALKYNHDLRLIVRGLDMGSFFSLPDSMREDLGKYPTYLYDSNPLNDVNYLFNKDVIFSRAYTMAKANDADNFETGITSFDDYSRWQAAYTFGIDTVMPDGVTYSGAGEPVHLSDVEKGIIYDHITQNVTSLADEYPETDFYYFFTPYSIAWYKELVENGTIYRQIEAEQYIIELILEHENIKLFSFNSKEELITDLNNYKDKIHYATWINSFMLRCMREDQYRLTKDNYQAYLENELNFFLNFDYDSLNEQIDLENDFYEAALWNESIWNVEPIDVLNQYHDSLKLLDAELVSSQYEDSEGIRCAGYFRWDCVSGLSAAECIPKNGYVGAKVEIYNIGKHNYLVFYGRKIAGSAQPTVLVFDSNKQMVGEISANYQEIDTDWHQYIIDLSDVEGDITVYFNGGYVDNTSGAKSEYIFSDIVLY